jgi:hypothetical protein
MNPARRWWRLRHAGHNPLVRGWDRLESAVLLIAVLLVLLALPVAGALGSHTYVQRKEVAATETATRHPATAVLTADAPPEVVTGHGVPLKGKVDVAAVWRVADGSDRTGSVPAERGLRAGTPVGIWLDEGGRPVAAPTTPGSALMAAVSAAVLGWSAFVTLVAAGFVLLRFWLDRIRYGRWEREWIRFDSNRSYS